MEGGRLIQGGGGRLLSSPVGNQAHLSPILQVTHRVINKVAIETGFPCTPTICIKDSDGGGEGALV